MTSYIAVTLSFLFRKNNAYLLQFKTGSRIKNKSKKNHTSGNQRKTKMKNNKNPNDQGKKTSQLRNQEKRIKDL